MIILCQTGILLKKLQMLQLILPSVGVLDFKKAADNRSITNFST
jgi:hypothetical protein